VRTLVNVLEKVFRVGVELLSRDIDVWVGAMARVQTSVPETHRVGYTCRR